MGELPWGFSPHSSTYEIPKIHNPIYIPIPSSGPVTMATVFSVALHQLLGKSFFLPPHPQFNLFFLSSVGLFSYGYRVLTCLPSQLPQVPLSFPLCRSVSRDSLSSLRLQHPAGVCWSDKSSCPFWTEKRVSEGQGLDPSGFWAEVAALGCG